MLETIALTAPIYVYALLLCVPYLSQKTVGPHWSTTIHLSTILFITWFCQLLDVILPAEGDLFSTIGSDTVKVSKEYRTLQILLALQPVLLLPALVLAIVIPRGPALHFPAEKIFTPKTLETLKERHAEQLATDPNAPRIPDALNPRIPNVTTEVQSGVWGAILFSYATPVIWKGYTALSMDLWDLPLPKANMRSMNQFRKMKEAYGATQKKRKGRSANTPWIDRLPAGWSLLIKVFRVNKGLFLARKCRLHSWSKNRADLHNVSIIREHPRRHHGCSLLRSVLVPERVGRIPRSSPRSVPDSMGLGVVFRVVRQQRHHVHCTGRLVVHLLDPSTVSHQGSTMHASVQQDLGQEGHGFSACSGYQSGYGRAPSCHTWRRCSWDRK